MDEQGECKTKGIPAADGTGCYITNAKEKGVRISQPMNTSFKIFNIVKMKYIKITLLRHLVISDEVKMNNSCFCFKLYLFYSILFYFFPSGAYYNYSVVDIARSVALDLK